MKAAIFAVLLLLPHVAHAKTWVDPTCQVMLDSEGEGFKLAKTDGTLETRCKIHDWPISSPTAAMTCDNGDKPTMTPSEDGSMQFGDVTLFPVGSKEVICD